VPIKVTALSLPRTLRILDVLFSSIAEHKCKLEWPKPHNTPISIRTENETLQFSLIEVVERKRHQPTGEEVALQKREYCWNPPRWDYNATGRLKLTLESVEFPAVCNSWSDGKHRKLEDCIGEVVVACEGAGPAIRQARKKQAEDERRRIVEQKRRYEAEILRAEYERKARVVRDLAQSWRESNLFADFAAALQAKALTLDLPDNVRHEMEAMIDWTLRHAVYLNPLAHANWTIRQFKNPPCLYTGIPTCATSNSN